MKNIYKAKDLMQLEHVCLDDNPLTLSVENAGNHKRPIYFRYVKGILKAQIGCFDGTKEEIIIRIKEKYKDENEKMII